jgi:hypothetical protein
VALRSATSKRFSPFSLDAINFLLADVRGALGPYLNVFLVTQQHWSQSEVGLVTTIGGLLGIAVQTPIGGAIDNIRAKRGAIILALAVLAVSAVIIFAQPTFWPVAIANSLISVVGDVFGPAVAALTLGLYARKHLARRMGRNSAFDHAGNVAIAVMAGAVGYAFSQRRLPSGPSLRRACKYRGAFHSAEGNRFRSVARLGQEGRRGRRCRCCRLRCLVQVPSVGGLWLVRHAVPFRQRAAVATGGTEVGGRLSKRGDGDDVRLHRRRAVGDVADRPAGRTHG